MTLLRRVSAEILGTGLLLATVVGSGIMAERLAGGNVAVALLANSLATGAGLVTLILTFGPISGAHFNPVVSLLALLRGQLAARDCAAYILGQVLGAFAGVTLAHVMYELPLITMSQHARAGMGLAASEFVATLGLLLVIALTARHRRAVRSPSWTAHLSQWRLTSSRPTGSRPPPPSQTLRLRSHAA